MDHTYIKEEPEDYFEYENIERSSENVVELDIPNATCEDESAPPCQFVIKEEILENPPAVNYDEMGEFCFESDHPALKSNDDYKKVLEAIFILEAQRAQAIKDLDRLYELQEEALADPIAFVGNLQNKRNLQIPAPQKIHQLPVIDWSKYALGSNPSVFGRRQLPRKSAKVSSDLEKNGAKGKGNHNGESKSKGNQYWSAEEQKRLEELLVQFPSEVVESHRWEKIAKCLENRTPLQVASRIQKYFIKLTRAGLPVPGRTPNLANIKKPRRSVIRQQPSTFLVSHQPPVYMPDGEDEFDTSYSQPQSTDETSLESKNDMSDEDDLTPEMKDTEEYKELLVLQKILTEKKKISGLAHVDYKCSRCKTEPISGVRWHCTECKTSVDFCSDCADSEYEFDQHTSDHHLEMIEHATNTTFMDCDYVHSPGRDYNYLDPNYMPAA